MHLQSPTKTQTSKKRLLTLQSKTKQNEYEASEQSRPHP